MTDTLAESLPAHAPFGPSAAEGWSTCLDYVNANRGLPDDTSKVAAEGTFAHAISDDCLSLGLDAFDFIGQRMKVADWEFEWTDDDADLLQPGIEWIRQQGGMFFGEHRVDISKWTVPGQFGTLDRGILVCIDGEWWIVTIDLKWGRGVPVSPVKNKQLVLYTLGLWDEVKHLLPAGVMPKFRLMIDQPRCGGGGGEWMTSLDELQRIGAWLKERATLASTMPNPPRTASNKGCMWCRRRDAPGGCDTFETFMLDMLHMQFDDVDDAIMLGTSPPLPSVMTPERRAYLLENLGGIERWLEDHASAALTDALQGNPCGGLKAVEGRKSPDKWRDKEAAEAVVRRILGEQSFNKRLITPTQAGKKIDKEAWASAIEPYVVKGVKKPTLVPEADARPAILSVDGKFDEEE